MVIMMKRLTRLIPVNQDPILTFTPKQGLKASPVLSFGQTDQVAQVSAPIDETCITENASSSEDIESIIQKVCEKQHAIGQSHY